jgi:pyruvate dehydrogenase kinase 2/3/4
MERRYHITTDDVEWPPEVSLYNSNFTRLLEVIKRRHDPTVSTVAQGVLEWKKTRKTEHIGLDIQSWLDRFYMSRIGIRFLIGQRECLVSAWSYKAEPFLRHRAEHTEQSSGLCWHYMHELCQSIVAVGDR